MNKDTNIFLELTKAVDLVCQSYHTDLLYDREALCSRDDCNHFIWCANVNGTHISLLEWGGVHRGWLIPKIAKDPCFSGSAFLAALITVTSLKGMNERSLPMGRIVWLSFGDLQNLILNNKPIEETLWGIKLEGKYENDPETY